MGEIFARRRFVSIAVAVTASVVLPATQSTLAASGTNDVGEHQIAISHFIFETDVLAVKLGDKVTWINLDIVPHTATAKDGSWDTGLIKPGESVTVEITAGMTGKYFCEYHPTMVAELSIDQ